MNTWAPSTRRQSAKMESADASAVVDTMRLQTSKTASVAKVLSGLLTSSDDKKPLSELRPAIPDWRRSTS